nr:G102 [uncultured bacterium]
MVFQTLLDGETRIYNAGKYLDKIVRVNGALRFREKLCIFDTNRIQTLMVTPI